MKSSISRWAAWLTAGGGTVFDGPRGVPGGGLSHRKLVHDSYQCPKWLEYECVHNGRPAPLRGHPWRPIASKSLLSGPQSRNAQTPRR